MDSLLILNRNFADLNPLQCGWEQCVPSHNYGPAVREHYLFHYILSGEGCFLRNNREIKLQSGSMFLIRPGEVTFYKADGKNPWSYIWIGFGGEKSDSMIGMSPFSENRCAADVPYLGSIFNEIKTHGNMSANPELYILSRLYEIFALMAENAEGLGRDYVRRAEDFMRMNYTMPITIQGIADMIGIDRRYLCSIFAAAKGRSPKEFLTELRLGKAVELLKNGATVGEAARNTGYDDVFNFSKAFKKKYGTPPSTVRNER